MFEYEGSEYTLEEVTKAAEDKKLSVEDYVSKFNLKEIKTEQPVGKPNDVVVEDATVTSEPEQASESMELEPVDTSLVSQPKRRSVRGQQRAKELERIENRQQQEAIEDAVEEIEVSETVFDELPDVEKVKLQDLAVDQIELDYRNKGVEEYEIKPEEINAKASEILKQKTQPSVIESYAAQAVRGFAGFAKGISQMGETIQYSLMETALDTFEPEYKGTVEEKQAIMGLVKAGGLQAPGTAKLPPSSSIGKFIEKLEPSIREYETQTITEEIEKGNYLKAGERAVGAAIESLPSLVAAATGVGGLFLLGGSVSGGKFMEEFEADPEKSTGTLLANAGLTGVTEASFELVTRGILSKARLLKDTGADKAARDLIRGGSEKLITSLGLNTLKEGGSEAATKVTTLFLDQLTLGKDIDWGKEAYNIIDEGIVGSVMGSGTTFAGALANTDKAVVERAQMILTPSENKKQLIQSANNISKLYKDAKSADVEGVKLINEAIKAEEANIVNIKKETTDALNSMTPAELKVYAGNQNELRKLQQQIQSPKTTESVKQLANKKFIEIRDENDVLFQESVQRRIQRGVEVVTKAAEKLEGVTVQSFDTTQEVENFIKQQDPEADIKASQQQGFIIQNPITEEQTIVINKEVANKEKAMNIAGHEFGHAVLFKTVKDSPETAVNLGEALLGEINKIDAAQVKDSKFKSRLEQYSADPKSIKMEEAITLFSDALATGDIKFNENIFTKIGDQIRRVMQSFGVKVKFNTGRDVYNFIKDYNKSIEKGIIGKAQIKAAKEGVKGALVKDAVKEAETIIKESRSEEASQEVQRIYEEQGEAGAFDIIEQFKPITNKIVDRRRDAPGFNREDLTSEIELGKRGILDLIKEYDPESGVPLAAYINKFLPARAIEASNRVLGEQFTEDVTEAKGVAAEEAVTEVVEERVAKKIKPTSLIPAESVAEIKKQVVAKVKDIPADKLTFKKLGDLAPDVIAEAIGIPVKKLVDPKANLSKGDANAIQRFVSKNADKLLKILPEGAVLEAATEKLIGTSTGVPKGLLNAFYTKQARVGKGAGLAPFKKNKGITKSDFLKAFGIIEGKKAEDFSARSPEAQALKGIANLYGRLVTNEVVRSETDLDITQKQDVAAGKARLMFSKTGIASDMNTTVEKAGGKVLGNTIEDNQTFRTFLVDELTKFLGSEANRIIKPSDVAGAGNSAVGSTKTSGAKGRGFRFIGDINKTQRFIDETNAAIAAGEVMDLQVLRNEIKDKANLLSEEQIQDVIAATSSQTRASMSRNKTNKDKIKRGKRLILDALFRAVQADVNNLGSIRELLYNANANSSFGRKFATVTSIESNLKPKQKTWEEHVFQFGNWANRTLQAYGTKDPNIVNGWLNWAEDNYYQEVTGRDTQGIVDGVYPGWKSKFQEHPYLKEKLDEAFKTGDFSQVPPSDIRKYNEFFTLDPNTRSRDGITDAKRYNVSVDKKFESNTNVIAEQGRLIYQQFIGEINAKQAENQIKEYIKIADNKTKASAINNNENNTIKFSKQVPNQEVLDNLGNADQAMANARNPEAPVKKIRVFDFDDTLARSKSNVLYEMPDGTTGKLDATQFAERAGELEAQGAEFDFSEFSKVIDGKKGPVFKAIQNIVKARGAEDVFILTARPADAAGPIKEFMDALGVNLPIENIVGLGDGKAEAKARWMTGKAAEGYNDFFFVDDAYKNVKAVQDALDVFDVKSKTQQAKVKFSKASDLDKGFNDIIEAKTGIASEKEYKRVKAEVAGAGKGRFNFFIPPSAEDFVGLLYDTLSKGKLGDSQMAWYKKHLLNPYGRAMNELSSARIALMNDYKQLKKQLKVVPKNLRKKVPGEPYTREQAVRVYIWNTQGMDVPGISKADLKDLTEYVSDNADLQVFADQLIAMQKGDQYAKPKEGWPAGTITTDLLEGLNTTKRAKYLEQWQNNVDVIFSEKNLNKLQAAYGKGYRKALENMLQRMKTGRNRNFSGDSLTGRFTDWITGSIGTIMFFNTRSAILQTISAINFVNFTDNNILAAGKAFGNQKQFWSDFLTLANSDFLKERRGGLRINVNEADIADMAKKGGVQGVINKLLEFGFTPTQLADSFAIASGGATFYRNRIKTYEKQGLDSKEAQDKAFVDFREIAEESQQSSRPDRISMQQAGSLGRLVLAFANTPAQYARLIKKAARDLKNGRGDAKTNMSKIIYYGVAQNLLFNALQQALFAFAFGDTEPEDEEKEKKYIGIANGMMDSLLRGMGLGGAVISVGKNALKRIYDEMQKKQPKLEKVGYELTKLSPPISAKLSRINQAARSYQWDKKEMAEKGWSLDNPAYLASANVVSALTNIPLDRAVKKTNNVVQATSQDLETWERMALLGGWSDWEIGIKEENETTKPQPRKIKKRKIKRKKIK
jgi:hypothetical protein